MRHLNQLILVVLIFSLHNYAWSQKEKEVKVKIGKENIYGTLVTVSDKNAPLVLIIPGSGPTDRDGNNVIMQTNTYRLLAEKLAENGISSLRYDKSGIGKSTSEVKEMDLRFEDNVTQVTAWIDFLNKKKLNKIVLLGHSEGSLIGMLAAQEREVAGLISMEGTGRTIDVVITEQITEQAPQFLDETKEILEQLKKDEIVSDIPQELASIFRESVQPYIISWIKYDPKKEIGHLAIPVLIVHGTTDIQVTEEDANLQKEGNPKAQFAMIEGMNHILKTAPLDKNENIKTYYNPKLPLHPELVPVIVEFVKKI